jgi:hypothetical protein
MYQGRARILALATALLPITAGLKGTVLFEGSLIQSMVTYYDEFYLVFCLFYRFVLTKEKFIRRESLVINGVITIYLIGLVSNFNSQVITLLSPITIDMLTMFKPLLAFVFLRGVLSVEGRHVFVSSLLPFAKLFIITACLFAILSQFIELGMTDRERYGIKAFSFLFKNHAALGICVIACLLVVSASSMSKMRFFYYLIMSFLVMISTTKGVVYSFMVASIFIFIFDRRASFKFRYVAIMSILIVLASSYQIEKYLLDSSSPRMLFLTAAVDIANEYAPLGTGFATFASEQARQNYSELYHEYGFNFLYGMDEEGGMFLNDAYVAAVIAQTGYIGTVIYLFILFQVYKIVQESKNILTRSRVLFMAAIITLYITSVATGIFKSTNGVFLFSMVAVLMSKGTGASNAKNNT